MKKAIFLSLAVIFGLQYQVYPMGVGGVETQGQGKIAVGLEQELTFDRDLKVKSIDPDTGSQCREELDKMSLSMAKASYGLSDNLDLYVKLGSSDFKVKGTWNDAVDSGTISDKARNAVAYGFGLKGFRPLEDNWLIGVDAQYLTHRNKYRGSIDNETSPASSENYTGKMKMKEWHIASYLAKKLGKLLPYAGVKYSDLRIEDKYALSTADIKAKIKADDNMGVFAGMDYKMTKNCKINIEGRFVDETAMSFGIAYIF